MISTALFCIIMLAIIDLLIIYWIVTINNKITTYQSSESPICPVYFCDEFTNPSTGELNPGSYCYVTTTGQNNVMVAYRYTDSSNNDYQCQKYPISDNIILTDQKYLPQSSL